ncbi:hypothetical protein HYS91_03635 [Candidatus Daviesbacteria bacterium]|nr:hypothetical protein [Candidatus Daviesbacteria bacterium]
MNLLYKFRSYPFLSRKIILSLIVVTIVAALIQIWVVNRLSTYGEQIISLEKSANVLELENKVLRNKLDKASSLKEINILARNLGFESIKKIEYLQDIGIALNK